MTSSSEDNERSDTVLDSQTMSESMSDSAADQGVFRLLDLPTEVIDMVVCTAIYNDTDTFRASCLTSKDCAEIAISHFIRSAFVLLRRCANVSHDILRSSESKWLIEGSASVKMIGRIVPTRRLHMSDGVALRLDSIPSQVRKYGVRRFVQRVQEEAESWSSKPTIRALYNIEFLNLRRQRLYDLRDVPEHLLEVLDRCKRIESGHRGTDDCLAHCIRSMKNLKTLVVYHTDLTEVSRWICRLQLLINLSFHYCHGPLPERLDCWKTLRALAVSHCDGPTLHKAVERMMSLETLSMEHLAIRALPSIVCHSAKLKRLEICSTTLEALPAGLANLTSLEVLLLRKTRLRTLPESIGTCTSLRHINLLGNPLESLPDSLVGCTALTELRPAALHKTFVPRAVRRDMRLRRDQSRR